jgi:hypothetical protein
MHCVLLTVSVVLAGQSAELIERTLAIVGGQVITLSDVQTAAALGLVDGVATTDSVDVATPKLVERLLILREVQRYSPAEPTDAEIAERLAQVQRRFPNLDSFRRVLDAGGFTEARVRAWLRDDLRIAAYLRQRFAAAGAPSEDEVTSYYTQRRDEFDKAGNTVEEAMATIRERLAAERRAELIAAWIGDLRRRTAVIELWRAK